MGKRRGSIRRNILIRGSPAEDAIVVGVDMCIYVWISVWGGVPATLGQVVAFV